MPALPPRLSLEQVRRLAKDLLRDLKDGDRAAIRRLAVVSAPSTLAGAQLAIAREYGFPSWARLKRDVELREILDSLDVGRLRALVAEEPDLASTTMEHWVDHPAGASPLGYVAMLRYDTTRGIWREVDGAGAIAGILVAAGAPVDGQKGVPETPLITAASYGDAGVARVLIGAGADLEARASDVAGGVPGGTALLHAAVFGMSDVVDVLVEAGARIEDAIRRAFEHVAVSSTLKASTVAIARRRDLDGGDDLALARISRERDRAALRFAKDRDLGQLEATMARLDAEAQAAVVRPSRIPTAAEARAYLESLPDLWAKTSDAGRKAIAEAVFERIDVLGATDYTFALTAHAKARGWDAALRRRRRRRQRRSFWSGREDLNLRPHRPERCALPSCATPRPREPVVQGLRMIAKVPRPGDRHAAARERRVTKVPSPSGPPRA